MQVFQLLLLSIMFTGISVGVWIENKKEQHNPKPVDRFEYEQNLLNASGRTISFYAAIALSIISLMLWITLAAATFLK